MDDKDEFNDPTDVVGELAIPDEAFSPEFSEAEDADDKKSFKRYEVLKGFVRVPIARGFTEIKPLYDALQKWGGKAFICGGYVRYMCSSDVKVEPAGDVDVYCQDKETFEAVKKEFSAEMGVRHENDNAITYSRPDSGRFRFCPTIQLVKPVLEGAIVAMGDMETILSNFDFTVVRGGVVSETECMVDANFEHDEALKFLRILNIHCPISSTLRFMKYSKKGYWTTPFEALKLFRDWDGRDDSYRDSIVEQVTKIDEGEELTQEKIDELERMMGVD